MNAPQRKKRKKVTAGFSIYKCLNLCVVSVQCHFLALLRVKRDYGLDGIWDVWGGFSHPPTTSSTMRAHNAYRLVCRMGCSILSQSLLQSAQAVRGCWCAGCCRIQPVTARRAVRCPCGNESESCCRCDLKQKYSWEKLLIFASISTWHRSMGVVCTDARPHRLQKLDRQTFSMPWMWTLDKIYSAVQKNRANRRTRAFVCRLCVSGYFMNMMHLNKMHL